MSNLRTLLDILSENTVSGGIATSVSMPVQEKVDDAPEQPDVMEYGNWENSSLTTSTKLKKQRKTASKVVKSIYGEDVSEAANPQQQAAIAIAKKEKNGVSEGRFVKGPGGVPLDRQGNPKPPKIAPEKIPAQPKLTLDMVWRKVEDVVGQIFPDGDPYDYLMPWFKKHGIKDFKVGDILDRAAKKNGYKDVYDYYDSMKDMYSDQQGVAEGSLSDVVKGIKRTIKGKEHPDVVAAKHAGRAMGHYNQGDIKAGDKESQRYVKTRDMHLKAKGVAEGTEQVYKVLAVDKSNALSDKVMLTVKAGSIEEVFERLAINDWYPFEINGVEVINGKRLKKGLAEGSGPQKGDPVYYGSRLVGWFLGYSKYGKVITKPNYDEMGDEYANRDVYWDKDAVTIKSDKQGVAEGSIKSPQQQLADAEQKLMDIIRKANGEPPANDAEAKERQALFNKIKRLRTQVAGSRFESAEQGVAEGWRQDQYKKRGINSIMDLVRPAMQEKNSVEGWIDNIYNYIEDNHMETDPRWLKAKSDAEKIHTDWWVKNNRPTYNTNPKLARQGDVMKYKALIQNLAKEFGDQGVAEGTEELEESDLILNPASISKAVRGLVPHSSDRTDHEIEMAKSDLYQAGKNAARIFDLIKGMSEEEGLEGWVQEKIIKAADYLNTVTEYLEGKQLKALDVEEEMFESKGKK
jgi:hypothetical protein